MQSSMTLGTIAVLFSTMLLLSFIPSISLLTVASRSAAYGFLHGAVTTLGIIAGDILFILLVIYGLALLSGVSSLALLIVRYIGGGYLLWLGIKLWQQDSIGHDTNTNQDSSHLASFLIGFLITVGDQKAILFYLGFLPAFLHMRNVTSIDTVIIIIMASVAIAGAKLSIALITAKGSELMKSAGALELMNRLAAGVIIIVGIFVVVSA